MSASVIHRVYDGIERSDMFAYSSATQAVAGIVFMMASGYLAAINWKLVFIQFLVQIPLFIIIYYKLPQAERPQEVKERVSLKDSIRPMTMLI